MSLALFNSVPAGAIENLFHDQNQPWFKRADLGRYLGIVKVKNSMHIPSHFICKRQDIEEDCCTVLFRKRKNSLANPDRVRHFRLREQLMELQKV